MSTNLSDTSHINDNLAKDLSHIIYALFSHSSTELNSFETCYAHASRIVARGELSRDRVSDLLRSEPEEIAQAHARVYQWLEEGPSGRKISFQELGFDKHPTSASKDTTSQPSKVPPARSSTTKPLADFDSQRFKQDMMAWILKGAEFPTWTPDPNEDGAQDVKSMRLPCLLDGRGPQMLLHNLSCFEEQAYDLLYPPMERGAKNHKMFINASGSGKTRLCFELLHSKFGFYFTCALHSESTSLSAIGSRDYASMVNDLRRDPDLVQDMTHHPTNSLTCLSESNRAIAHRRLVALLAARFRVCQLFLSCFPRTALLSPKVKRGWLFLQIQPGLINPKGVDVDVFEEAYKYFASRSIGESERYIEKALDTGSRTHTVFSEKSAQDIVIVIDEAQMATDILPRAFLSQTKPFDSGLPMWRSILRETIVCWRSLPTRTLVKNLIVTGTGLSMEKFEELKDSAAVKPQHWTMVHETGSFSTAEEQWQYAVKFLPKSVVRTNGPSIRLLRFRMWHWLRGRHRWTANFMQYLLTYLVFDGQGLQIMFNQFVQMVAGFKPTDIDDAHFNRTDVVRHLRGTLTYNLSPVIPFERLDDLPQVREYMVRNTYKYFLRSKPFELLKDNDLIDKLMTIGVGRFTQVIGLKRQFCISEPLVIFAALAHFNQYFASTMVVRTSISRETLWNFVMKDLPNNTPDLNNFEDATALVFAHVFNKKGTELKDGLNFEDPDTGSDIKANVEGYLGSDCPLSDYRARLVTVYKRSHETHQALGYLEGYFDIFPANGMPCYAGCLGRTSKDSSRNFETGAFITHEHGAHESLSGVLFPDTHMGPDILFPVRLTSPGKPTHYAWVAVQCKYHTTAPPNLSDAIRSVSPGNFYKNKTGDPLRKEVRDCNSASDAALRGSLPVRGGIWDKSDSYNLLRVLVTGNKDFCWKTETMGKYSPVKPPLDPRLPEPEGSLTQATTANRYADLCTDPLARLPVEMLKVLTENLWSQRSFHTHEQEHAYKEAHRVQQQEERLLTKCDLRKSRAHKNEAAKAERQTHISRRRSMSREASVVIIAPPLPPPPAKATRPKHQLSAPTQRMTEKQAPAPKKAKK